MVTLVQTVSARQSQGIANVKEEIGLARERTSELEGEPTKDLQEGFFVAGKTVLPIVRYPNEEWERPQAPNDLRVKTSEVVRCSWSLQILDGFL